MAKNGFTTDSALSKNLGLALGFGKDQRQMRDESRIQKSYQSALQEINLILDHAAMDAFSSTIKSQRQRLYTESQGFNTLQEKMFCVKRRELLAAVERGYSRLRAHALGISLPESKKGRCR